MCRQTIEIAARLEQALNRIHQIGFLQAEIGEQLRRQFFTVSPSLTQAL